MSPCEMMTDSLSLVRPFKSVVTFAIPIPFPGVSDALPCVSLKAKISKSTWSLSESSNTSMAQVADKPSAETVMVAFPLLLPSTKPKEETLATELLDEDQERLASLPCKVATSCSVCPMAIDALEWLNVKDRSIEETFVTLEEGCSDVASEESSTDIEEETAGENPEEDGAGEMVIEHPIKAREDRIVITRRRRLFMEKPHA